MPNSPLKRMPKIYLIILAILVIAGMAGFIISYRFVRITSTSLTEEQIFKAMYGNYDPVKREANWDIAQAERSRLEEKVDIFGILGEKSRLLSTLIALQPIEEENGRPSKYAVLFKSRILDDDKISGEKALAALDCHACGAFLDGAIFAYKSGNWELASNQKFLNYQGTFGDFPDPQIVMLGLAKDKAGFKFNLGYTGQGYTHGSILLFGIYSDQMKKVFELNNASGDNFGVFGENDPAAYQYNSNISFIPGANAGYYDLKVVISGTRSNGLDAVEKVNKETVYKFKEGEYRSKEPLGPANLHGS